MPKIVVLCLLGFMILNSCKEFAKKEPIKTTIDEDVKSRYKRCFFY